MSVTENGARPSGVADGERHPMKTLRVYRNPHCAKCARFAKLNHLLDWLNRLEPSTDAPATGPLRMGEVVVEDLATGRIHRGVEGIEMVWRNIPVFMLLRPLLWIPAFRRYVDRDVRGCEGDECSIGVPHDQHTRKAV